MSWCIHCGEDIEVIEGRWTHVPFGDYASTDTVCPSSWDGLHHPHQDIPA